ncbi:hypothetical protein [Sphingopyxis macrogoltabida]|uniref:Uncharacterized protein n=2 Tax=Sphingopyxis macrogoltabida TaxID=33050 RepID=A0AAC8YX64_SPHMC|nr:hypothetical protein [Sphingopyxis macrogoltabida]ALJ11711.1 hypothetical protein LH19_02420 [Sphingopyxis macrogoltabida]AMU87898.1 hypothetical protein ATM17_02395 [Sphingopyxis macrogoltabida]
MLKQRLEAANDVARKLVEAERAIENAIAATGVLAGALAQGQAKVGLSAVAADPAYSNLAVSFAGLFQAHANMVALHKELEMIKDAIGLRNFRIEGTGDAAKILRPTGGNDRADPTAQVA